MGAKVPVHGYISNASRTTGQVQDALDDTLNVLRRQPGAAAAATAEITTGVLAPVIVANKSSGCIEFASPGDGWDWRHREYTGWAAGGVVMLSALPLQLEYDPSLTGARNMHKIVRHLGGTVSQNNCPTVWRRGTYDSDEIGGHHRFSGNRESSSRRRDLHELGRHLRHVSSSPFVDLVSAEAISGSGRRPEQLVHNPCTADSISGLWVERGRN